MSSGDDSQSEQMAALLSRAVTDLADVNAALMTSLDIQARILALVEGRDVDDVVDEVSAQLKHRRREALRELDQWFDSLDSGEPRN
jgi:hypothetical protein